MRRRHKKVRQQCQEILNSIGYDFKKFSMTEFKDAIEKHLCRTIYFLDLDIDKLDFLGAWITNHSEPHEYILTRKDKLSPTFHLHVQCHEIGHLLLQHNTLAISLDEISNDPLSIQKKLTQSTELNTQEQEVEAETMAYLIQSKILDNGKLNSLTPAQTSPASKIFYSMGVD